ncbi:hypothetical protein [Ruegeria aquimaris]|uniref:Uncharacterized protein n=1 Tax=Ruegeria aquimaris TaxID=2984333 RepID=A0ABT3AHA6_9RHOB|nr:hypothetical protein [Ruegeria sp. XHP0148]MCV2888028.1 hypothetical protein [Ruegeria sp. XHP0148]
MQQNEWILDVLSDLKSFAMANGLNALAEQLDDTKLIAAAEIASKHEEALALSNGRKGRFGTHLGGAGRSQRA